MRLIYLMLLITFFQIFSKSYAGCLCNKKGKDYCETCTEHKIVRPKQKYEPITDLNLPPIGDSCWCSKSIVEPAALPKPCPKHKSHSCGCKSKHGCHDSYTVPSYPIPQVHYKQPVYKDDSLPADPISVSLAFQAGKAIEVPEAKLAYGFVQKPIDGLKKIYFSNVPEENLYKLKSEVITLKKQPKVLQKDEDEDLDDNEEIHEPYPDDPEPYVTYKQLGYVREQYKNPQFHEVPPSLPVHYENKDCPSYAKKKIHTCGYKADHVSDYH